MSDKTQPTVLGSLPRTRPHRRSDKRASLAVPPAAEATPAPKPQAAPKPRAAKRKPTAARPAPKRAPAAKRPPVAPPAPPAESPGALETAVQAAAELAEIGLQASARALRRTLSRLPRP
jgi:hypothetical protein